jgi:ATP-dependent Clp endopeptidase proteolytic subunit ClpP
MRPNLIKIDDVSCRILLYGPILSGEEGSAETFIKDLAEASAKFDNIFLHINSPGGEVLEGIAIFNWIKDSQKKITCVVDGVAASMAGVIALAGDSVQMNRYAKLMLHAPSGSARGNSEELRQAADMVDSMKATLTQMLADRTGQTPEEVAAKYLGAGDAWFTAQEAFEQRLIDKIIPGIAVTVPKGQERNATAIHALFTAQLDTLIPTDMIRAYARLGFTQGLTPSEEEVLAKIQAFEDRAVAAETSVAELQAKVDAHEAVRAEARKTEITAILDNAVATQKFSAKQRGVYQTLLEKDFENGKAAIDAMSAAPRIVNMLGKDEKEQAERAAWKFSDWQKKAPADLTTMRAENPDAFNALYKAEYGKDFNF